MQWIFGFNKTAVLAKQTDAFHLGFQEFTILVAFSIRSTKLVSAMVFGKNSPVSKLATNAGGRKIKRWLKL